MTATVQRIGLGIGSHFRKKMPNSEACMSMRIAGQTMEGVIKSNGMVQLLRNNMPWGGSITTGEAGIYHDDKPGLYYYHQECRRAS